MRKNIEGKVVIVTGASSGLGEATARHLAELGATVVLAARRADRLRTIVEDIRATGGKAKAFEVDVSKKIEVEDLVQKTVETFGRLDVVVNNAGLMAIAPLAKGLTEEWERMIDINVKGVLYGIAAALPVFVAQKSGHFINIASVAGLKVGPGGAVYSGTKFAVRAISEGLRQEVGPHIRTTIVSPGAVASELKLGTSDTASAKGVAKFYAENEISADSVARAIAYAIEQPADVDINEIVLRPTAQSS